MLRKIWEFILIVLVFNGSIGIIVVYSALITKYLVGILPEFVALFIAVIQIIAMGMAVLIVFDPKTDSASNNYNHAYAKVQRKKKWTALWEPVAEVQTLLNESKKRGPYRKRIDIKTINNKNEIAKAYVDGMPIEDIISKYNLENHYHMYRILDEKKIKRRTKTSQVIKDYTSQIADGVLEDYKKNMTLSDIKTKYRTSTGMVYHILKKKWFTPNRKY